jgi:hypothetical protein
VSFSTKVGSDFYDDEGCGVSALLSSSSDMYRGSCRNYSILAENSVFYLARVL